MAGRVFHAGAFPTGAHHPLMGPENHGARPGWATVAGSHVSSDPYRCCAPPRAKSPWVSLYELYPRPRARRIVPLSFLPRLALGFTLTLGSSKRSASRRTYRDLKVHIWASEAQHPQSRELSWVSA